MLVPPLYSRMCTLTFVPQEDKSRLTKAVTKEYEDVMHMMREVFLFQYRNSPSVVEHHRQEGVGNRLEPFQRLTEICTPDSLDTICSVYEAYRSIVQQIQDAGTSSSRFIHTQSPSSLPPCCCRPFLPCR